ncbi:MAG: YybH family protein [Pyrinomonadaceae bacterium]
MKYYTLICLFILTFGFNALGQTNTVRIPAKRTKIVKTPNKTTTVVTTNISADDEKAVRDTFEDLLNGIRNSNVDAVTNVYWNSPQMLYFNSNGSITLGWDQDRKNRESRYPKTSNVKLDVSQVRVTMLGSEGALITCLWKQTQDYEAVPESAAGRMTLVFKKFGKDWKVIHLHTSPTTPSADRPVLPSEREN